VSKLKIGYWPLSPNLKSAGDRRRLVFWAHARGHEIVTNLNERVDLIVASENSDYNSPYLRNHNVPIIFDLVDAYLSPLNSIDDLARGFAKRLSGQISGVVKPFSHHVRDFCKVSNAVICSSSEQEEVIKNFNMNTHVILDSHDEIPFMVPQNFRPNAHETQRILWEGQPATIRGVGQISPVLTQLSKMVDLQIDFVTDEKYFHLLNRYFERETLSLLKKDLAQIVDIIGIIPWSPKNLVNSAEKSTLAIIPIDLSIPMQRLKPENRLLIMWRLGLPCLTSPSPAYVRVAKDAGVAAVCFSTQDWVENFNLLLSDSVYAKNEILNGQNYLHENHNRSLLLNKWDLAFESVMG
jgi:hypothetical protein